MEGRFSQWLRCPPRSVLNPFFFRGGGGGGRKSRVTVGEGKRYEHKTQAWFPSRGGEPMSMLFTAWQPPISPSIPNTSRGKERWGGVKSRNWLCVCVQTKSAGEISVRCHITMESKEVFVKQHSLETYSNLTWWNMCLNPVSYERTARPVPSKIDPRIIKSGKQTDKSSRGRRRRRIWCSTINEQLWSKRSTNTSCFLHFTLFDLHHQSYFSAAVIMMLNQGWVMSPRWSL